MQAVGPVGPIANFTGAPLNGPAPLTVTFTDLSTGSVTNQWWDFGDGSTATGLAAQVTHTYPHTGSYTVTLVAAGPIGPPSTNQQPSLVVVTNPPATLAQYFTVTTNNGAITITGYAGSNAVINIPSVINGWPVTSIGNQAFVQASELTSVILPDSVTNIQDMAFLYCANLGSITLPSHLLNIGYEAFFGCGSLTSITIPKGVTSIQSGTFMNCYHLTNVSILGTLTSIGMNAFTDCSALSSFAIPEGVSSVGDFAFDWCQGLGSVSLPGSLTSLGVSVFAGCSSLTNINLAPTNPAYRVVGGVLFDKHQKTLIQFPLGVLAPSYTVPPGITSLGWRAFGWDNNLVTVTIPGSVTNLGYQTFSGCNGLRAICFQGNAPSSDDDTSIFSQDYANATVYYRAGTAGWSAMFDGLPTVALNVTNLAIGATDVTVAFFGVAGVQPGLQYEVDRSTNLLLESGWVPISTNTAPINCLIRAVDSFPDLGPGLHRPTPPLFYRLRYRP